MWLKHLNPRIWHNALPHEAIIGFDGFNWSGCFSLKFGERELCIGKKKRWICDVAYGSQVLRSIFGPPPFVLPFLLDVPPRLWVGCLLTRNTGRRKWIARKSWACSGYLERAKKCRTCRGLREDVKCGKRREAVLKEEVETNSWGPNQSHPREHNHLWGQVWDSFFSVLACESARQVFCTGSTAGTPGPPSDHKATQGSNLTSW